MIMLLVNIVDKKRQIKRFDSYGDVFEQRTCNPSIKSGENKNTLTDIVQNMIYLIETWDIYLLCPTYVNEPRVSETLVVIAYYSVPTERLAQNILILISWFERKKINCYRKCKLRVILYREALLLSSLVALTDNSGTHIPHNRSCR